MLLNSRCFLVLVKICTDREFLLVYMMFLCFRAQSVTLCAGKGQQRRRPSRFPVLQMEQAAFRCHPGQMEHAIRSCDLSVRKNISIAVLENMPFSLSPEIPPYV